MNYWVWVFNPFPHDTSNDITRKGGFYGEPTRLCSNYDDKTVDVDDDDDDDDDDDEQEEEDEDEDEDEEDAILPLCFVICSFVATTLRGHRYVFRPILVFWVQAEGLGS